MNASWGLQLLPATTADQNTDTVDRTIWSKHRATNRPCSEDRPKAPGEFDDLRREDTFSDFEIVCEHRKFRLHRIIVAAKSKYFSNVMTGGFKETDDRRIVLEGDKPDHVEAMVDYFYTKDFTIPCISSDSVDWELPMLFAEPGDEDAKGAIFFLLELYIVADKYDVPGLVDLVCGRLQDELAQQVHRIDMDTVFELVDFVYVRTRATSPVRAILLDFVLSTDLQALFDVPDSKEKLRKHEDFLFDTMKFFAQEVAAEKTKCCTQVAGKAVVAQGCRKENTEGNTAHDHTQYVVRSFFPGAELDYTGHGYTLKRKRSSRGAGGWYD